MKNLIFLFSLFVSANAINSPSLNAQTEGQEKLYIVEQIYFFDEMDYAFYQAYNAFLEGQDARAGARLRRAAYFVRTEADNAKAHNKKPILNQAQRLELLADSIALGRIESSYRLRRAFSRTHNILANDYKLRAATFWAADKTKDAGKAIVAATGYLGHAAKWTGKKVEKLVTGSAKTVAAGGKAVGKGAATAGVESFRGLRWLGSKMIQGIAFIPEKVGQGLGWLGKSIDSVGEEIEPGTRKAKKGK